MESNGKIREMCKNLGIAAGKMSNEYLFTIQCTDLFYYHGNIGQVDIKTGYVDGSRDGGIDFILVIQKRCTSYRVKRQLL